MRFDQTATAGNDSYCFAFFVRLLSSLKYHHSVCNDASVSQHEKNILHSEDFSNKADKKGGPVLT